MVLTEEQLRIWINTLRALFPEQRETLLSALPEDQREQIRKALAALPIEIPGDLLREIFRGNCVLFVGAGVAQEADVGLPSAAELALQIVEECHRLDPAYYRLEAHRHDPLDKVADDYVLIQNALSAGHGRARLESLLKALIPRTGRKPLDIRKGSYSFMVNIPKLSDLIITTNWDELLEEAVSRYAHRDFDVILNRDDLPALDETPGNVKIIKLHGTISRPETIVIGREDYEEMKRRLEPVGLLVKLADLLIARTVLFVGYSLEDSDFRFLYKFVEEATTDPQGRRKGRTHYALQAEVDRYRRLEWAQRGIVLMQGRGRDFFEKVFIETSEFVNRESQRELRSLAYRPCYEMNGLAGVGKSTLLKRIYDDVELALWQEKGIYRYYFFHKFPLKIVDEQEACEGLLSALAKRLGYPETEADRIKYAKNRQKWIEDTADNLARYFSVPTLLLFDCTTRLPRQVVQTMERLLQPALEEGSELRAIAASRYPIEWTDHQIRRLFTHETLPPFTAENVRDMLRYYAILQADATLPPDRCYEAAKEIMTITQGQPRAIKWVIEELGRDQVEQPLSSDPAQYVQTHKPRLVEGVVKDVVDVEILKDVDPDLRELLEQTLCVFRRLDTTVLHELAESEEMRGLEPAVRLLGQGLGLLRRLGELYLAAGPQERPLYTLDTIMRRILALHLKFSDPDKYMTLQRLGARMFDAEVPRFADQSQLAYIIEGLYHHLQGLQRQSLQEEQYVQIRELLSGYLAGLRSSGGSAQVPMLATQLKNWIKTEEELEDELFERFGQRYEDLLRLIDEFSEGGTP